MKKHFPAKYKFISRHCYIHNVINHDSMGITKFASVDLTPLSNGDLNRAVSWGKKNLRYIKKPSFTIEDRHNASFARKFISTLLKIKPTNRKEKSQLRFLKKVDELLYFYIHPYSCLRGPSFSRSVGDIELEFKFNK